jgi:DNA-binding CsgD family transcriptional regulator
MNRWQDLSAQAPFASRLVVSNENVEPRELPVPLAKHAVTIQLDACSREHVGLDVIWERLTTGNWRLIDQFTTEERLYFFLRAQHPPAVPLDVDLLLRTLLGERQKVVALETALSPSTLTTRLSSSLTKMGFQPKPARVPILLVASAVAAVRQARPIVARSTRLTTRDGEAVIISTPRLDTQLRRTLTPTEWLVATLLVDGLSHREVAKRRGCAMATVANQVSSVFRKLNISGRAELLLHAVTSHARYDERFAEPGRR